MPCRAAERFRDEVGDQPRLRDDQQRVGEAERGRDADEPAGSAGVPEQPAVDARRAVGANHAPKMMALRGPPFIPIE